MQHLQLRGGLVEHLQIRVHQGLPIRCVAQQLCHLFLRSAVEAFAQHAEIALADPIGVALVLLRWGARRLT